MSIRPAQVFISSTYLDLAAHRDAVAKAVQALGALPVMFEGFGASDEPAVARIGRNLGKSDVLILILAYRYGAVAEDLGKSYVEVEYDAARSRGIPVLAFLAAHDAPWPVSHIDADRSRIDAFRRRLMADVTVAFFTTPDDLTARVLQSLSHFLREDIAPKTQLSQGGTARNIHVVRLLLSSPGDVATERESFARAVFRFNQDAVEERGLFVRLIRWEDMAPQIGPGPQQVVNNQLGNYHLFAGIMWNRFGTPTDIASSGTEEEFDNALASWRNTRRPWITFYFCDRPTTFSTEQQLEQKQKVLRLRSHVGELGIVRSFVDAAEFENLVYRDLLRTTSLPDFLKLLS
jgi:hypothetical protein